MNKDELAQIQKEMRRLGERHYEEMVEAVAEAIFNASNLLHYYWNPEYEEEWEADWEHLGDEARENYGGETWTAGKNDYRRQARAAIDAVHAFQRKQARPALHEDGYPVEEMGS